MQELNAGTEWHSSTAGAEAGVRITDFLLSISASAQLVFEADSANTKHIKSVEQDDLRIRAEQGR